MSCHFAETSTWKIENAHVANKKSPRGRETFPPKFRLIPPKFYFTPTWGFFILHVEIFDFSRGDPEMFVCRRYKWGIISIYCHLKLSLYPPRATAHEWVERQNQKTLLSYHL